MRISIIGTGAVGGFFGAKLSLAGFDVSFLDLFNYFATNNLKPLSTLAL